MYISYVRIGFIIFFSFCTSIYSDTVQKKLKILYILGTYPVLSETYMHEEIAALWNDYTIKIITIGHGHCIKRENYFPYKHSALRNIHDIMRSFKPDIIHTHWLTHAPLVEQIASIHKTPFTIRTHSFDVLAYKGKELISLCKAAQSTWCLSVLTFPPFKKILMEHGLSEQKIVPCWPVINFSRFYNQNSRSDTKRILHVSAGLPKHDSTKFIDLAAMMCNQGFEFNMYIIDHFINKINMVDVLKEYNKSKGNPVSTITYASPEKMPSVYRDHDWLVLTANKDINTAGLPISIAEAQASGIGVCWQELPKRKHDQLEYLGGAGFLFGSINDLPAIFSQPYPEVMRLQGLENAKKCAIEDHKGLLTQVWQRHILQSR